MNLSAYGIGSYAGEIEDIITRYAQYSSFSNGFRWILIILSTIGMWNMFLKAGEPGWGAIIPFYRTYLLYKIADMKKAFWIYLVATIGTVVLAVFFLIIAFGSLVSVLGNGHGPGIGFAGAFIFIWLFVLAACIAIFVLSIMLAIKLAQAFNLNGGWAVGIFFLPFIFYMIIGFSKDIRYKNRFAGAQGFNGQGYAQNPYQQNPYQQNPYQQNPYAQADYQQNNYQQNNYQQNPYGQNPYAQNSQTQDPYAQNNYSQTTYAQNAYDQNVNQQNVNPYANPSKEDAWKTIYDDQSNNLNQ